ncbi:filaggrin-2-like isoform X2 [Hyalella azteca]|uniref:Superoxide dismutase [Cu-Zn] n=1 Tax=Hyalella azteca TaxID=294128 RepID=A0A979FPD8_HYAAZ|nr:filaggrin-2-like isoform X2 [Hyalella azteca]
MTGDGRTTALLVLIVFITSTRSHRSGKGKPDALVEMVPGIDEKVFGKLALYKKDGGVFIEGVIHNMKPGLHGFHVHEKGLLGNKCMDAGEHFNPLKKVHAGPKDLHRHAGDLGNVYADKNGVAKISIFDGHISLHPHDKTYIGKRSFVVHKKPDDLGRGGDDESLRTGNAGGRLSCGIVIQLGHSLKEPPPVYHPHDGSGKSGFGHGHGHGGKGHGHSGYGGGGSGHHEDHHGEGIDSDKNKENDQKEDDFGGFDDYDYDFGNDKAFGHSGSSHHDSHSEHPNREEDHDGYSSSNDFHHQHSDPFDDLSSFGSSHSVHSLPAPVKHHGYGGHHYSRFVGFSQHPLHLW